MHRVSCCPGFEDGDLRYMCHFILWGFMGCSFSAAPVFFFSFVLEILEVIMLV